ncbi:unnamed protein product, partial [marine sediment metagenome]
MVKPYLIRRVSETGRINRFSDKLIGHYLLIIPLNIKTFGEYDTLRSRCRHATEFCNF